MKFEKGTGAASRYKFVSEAENCHGAEVILRAAVRIRVHCFAVFCLGCTVCKNCDEQLTFIVRVRYS